jgi:DNA-binding Lrp family transcriptional regulator
MKTIIFAFINCQENEEKFVLQELGKIPIVKNVDHVIGTYDIVAKLESDLMEELNETITWKIRKIERVRSVLILMAKNTGIIAN